MSEIPDLSDPEVYARLRAEALEEIREDRRWAHRRAFRDLLAIFTRPFRKKAS